MRKHMTDRHDDHDARALEEDLVADQALEDDEETTPPKIGVLVKQYLPDILALAETDGALRERLRDAAWCKKEVGLSHPFMRSSDDVDSPKLHSLYWVTSYRVAGVEMRVTNDWYVRQAPKFVALLESLRLMRPDAASALAEQYDALIDSGSTGASGPATTSEPGTLPAYAIGITQNAVVRRILGKLEPSPNAWADTLDHFDHSCAYCGATGVSLSRDHIVPINKDSLGLHHIGNLAPACGDCNASKGKKDLAPWMRAVFPATADERIGVITAFQRSRGYVPITERAVDADAVRAILEQARLDVATVAEQAIASIQELLASESGEQR